MLVRVAGDRLQHRPVRLHAVGVWIVGQPGARLDFDYRGDAAEPRLIAVRPGLSAGLRDRLKDALMEMRRTEAGRAQMNQIFYADGFVPAADTDFAVVRELEQYLGD